MERTCTKCGQIKPLTEFVKARSRPGGYSPHCKACHRSYYKKRPKAQPLHPGDMKRCSKCGETKPVEEFDRDSDARTGYNSNCKECRRATSRAWKRRHKDEVHEYQAQWRKDNPKYNKEWRAGLPEETRQRYLQNRRAQARTFSGRMYNVHRQHLRRVAEKNGDVSPRWLERLHRTQTHCAYCGCVFDDSVPAAIDHVIPLSKGGTHTKDNIVLACKSCNSSKSDRLIDNAYTSGLSDLPLLGCLEVLQ